MCINFSTKTSISIQSFGSWVREWRGYTPVSQDSQQVILAYGKHLIRERSSAIGFSCFRQQLLDHLSPPTAKGWHAVNIQGVVSTELSRYPGVSNGEKSSFVTHSQTPPPPPFQMGLGFQQLMLGSPQQAIPCHLNSEKQEASHYCGLSIFKMEKRKIFAK